MRAATREYLKQQFSAYYAHAHLLVPPSLPEREWGFIFFDAAYPEIRMRRHVAFGSRTGLVEYIRNLVPAHVYYSSAYYRTPEASTMQEKGWAGADLIFDLDADHIVRGPYDVMLARVREETEKLLMMLTEELGFDPKLIEVVFSGGRGYHVHVRDIAVRGWGSAERRELIDYVCGIGIEPGIILQAHSPSLRGWRRRYIAALLEYLSWLGGLPPEEAKSTLSMLPGIGEVSAGHFLQRWHVLMESLSRDQVQAYLGDQVIMKVLRALGNDKESGLTRRLQERAARADEPVTTDTKRLIRMPGSLHGGSGFRVTPLSSRELHDFDPLVDAVVFGERGMQIDLAAPITTPLLGNTYRLEKGVQTVPEAVAVFLCCRGMAEIAEAGAHGPA
ncbi:MAG: DNA primase small subunit PriS [Methanoregulaceae archaeon]|nr:DNA primase small subunit PriS [Methanoregulaceae archaeon]